MNYISRNKYNIIRSSRKIRITNEEKKKKDLLKNIFVMRWARECFCYNIIMSETNKTEQNEYIHRKKGEDTYMTKIIDNNNTSKVHFTVLKMNKT